MKVQKTKAQEKNKNYKMTLTPCPPTPTPYYKSVTPHLSYTPIICNKNTLDVAFLV